MPSAYETMVVFDGSLDETTTRGAVEKIEAFLSGNGAERTRTDVWGRRELCYLINKKRTGFYVLFVYTANGEVPALLEKLLRTQEQVLRHLTVYHEPDKRTAASLPRISDAPRDGGPGDGDDEEDGPRPRGRRGRDNGDREGRD